MKKNSYLFRIILICCSCGCIITTILSAFIFYFIGIRNLAQQTADELLPRAYDISRITSRYFDGMIGNDSYSYFLTNTQSAETVVYIYDNQGNLFAQSFSRNMENYKADDISFDGTAYYKYVDKVLTSGEKTVETDFQKKGCLIVAVPVLDNLRRVYGVVLITKPAVQLQRAMLSMILSLLTGSLIIIFLLSLVFYFVSRKITKPINEMIDISKHMADGEFELKADTSLPGEFGELGSALNFLSDQLSHTISDLLLSRKRLFTILSGLTEGVFAVDIDERRITYENEAAQQLRISNGISFDEVSFGNEFFSICAEVAENNNIVNRNFTFSDSILEFSFSKAEDIGNENTMIIVLMRDITQAEKLELTRREYVANVSHELRTPIASIRSLAETLNDGLVKEPSDCMRYYGHILRESNRLTRLINDLLELSRLQARSMPIEKQNFSLSELLNVVYDRMKIYAEYSNIHLNYDKQNDEIFVYSSKDRIEQVLVALIDNAVKYSEDDGVVKIETVDKEEYILIQISNPGHLDEIDLHHIFERFYKTDKSHSGMGTGLGLAITKEVLEILHESIIAYNSDNSVVFEFTVHKM